MDRVIQQGIVQVISPMCEPPFSERSYGFRPNRSCETAIRQLLVYLDYIFGRTDDPHGINYDCKPKINLEMEKFAEICF